MEPRHLALIVVVLTGVGAGGCPARQAKTSHAATPGAGRLIGAFRPPWNAKSFAGEQRIEDEIVRQVNVLRRGKGLPPYRADERLRVASRQHTQEMFARNYYAHDSPVAAWRGPPGRACRAGFLDPYVGENIGATQGYADVATAMMDAWIKSPGHYANLVSKSYRFIGVGVASRPKAGQKVYYATQLFADSPVDLRRVQLRRTKRAATRLQATFRVPGGVKVFAFQGSRFVGPVAVEGGAGEFSVDLAPGASAAYSLALSVGATPLVCVEIKVQGGKTSHTANTFAPLCRKLSGLSVGLDTRERERTEVHFEARATTGRVKRVRSFLGNAFGPWLALRGEAWTPLALPAPRGKTSFRFTLLVGQVQKDYLVIEGGGLRCP